MVQFNFTYDSGLSLEQRVGFELAARIWGTYLTDDITVNLHIVSTETLEGNAIGGAVPLFHEQNYGILSEYLEQDVTSSDGPNTASTDEQVVETLQNGNTVDVLIDGEVVDGNSNVLLTSAQAKALGMDEAITLDNGTTWDRGLVDTDALDGYIVINQSYDWNYDFLRTERPQGETLDFLSLALHEIGHQLGFVSGLDGLLEVNQLYSGDTEADGFTLLDLFRHTADSQAIANPDGAVSDLTEGTDAMFSVNGGAEGLALFSTGQDGDGFQAAHWKRMKKALGIMDPTLAYKERLKITELDAQAMDALGYDVNYDAFNTGLDISALLLDAEMAVATQMGLDGSVLAEARSDGYPDGEYELSFAQWWQIFEEQILDLGYGEWFQLLDLGYGLWFQEFDAGLLELGYGAWFQAFEEMILELGYGTWFQEFEESILDLGYGNWWQLLELGYGSWWQQLETFFATLDTVGETAGETLIDLEGLPDNSGEGIFVGGNEDDIIGGTYTQDRVAGGHGDDLIDGKDGDDVIWGDAGKDVLYGYNGNDVIYGGRGDDLILGEAGDDQLLGEAGADIMSGGDGNDALSGGKGRDDIKGGDGLDVISGGQGDDWIKGNGQDDLLMGDQGKDKLEGGQGNDVVYGDQQLTREQTGLAALLQQFLASRKDTDSPHESSAGTSFAASPNGFVRIEAEDMALDQYHVTELGNASGGELIRNWQSSTGTAKTEFSGPTGRYMVIVNYLDESDGQATATVKINGVELDSWQFSQDNNQLTSRTIATNIVLGAGDTIELLGTKAGGENALIDYIDFVPLDSLLPTYTDEPAEETSPGPAAATPLSAVETSSSEPRLLIQNGSFDSDLDGWSVHRGMPEVSENGAYSGQSVSLMGGDGINQSVTVTAGKTYQISTFAKFEGQAWSGYGIDFYDINWQKVSTNSFQLTGETWTQYQAQVFAPEDAYFASIWANNSDNITPLLLDDISLVEIQAAAADPTAATTGLLEEGLVAHWQFDEGTGTTVTEHVSGENREHSHLTESSWITGMEAGALSFEGTGDAILVDDTPQLRLGENNSDFSVAFWFNVQSGPTGEYRTLLHKHSAQDKTFGIWLDGNSNRIKYDVSTTVHSSTGSHSQAELALNQWTHIAYVKEGNRVSLYLNGQFDSSMVLQGEMLAAEGTLQIAGEVDGDLDDLRLYNRALGVDEVISLSKYNADVIEGGTGQDFLYGDDGDDVVYGESSGTLDAISSTSANRTFNGNEARIFDHQDSMLLNEGTLSLSFTANDLTTGDIQHLFSKDSRNYDDGGHLSVYVNGDRLVIRLQSTSGDHSVAVDGLKSHQFYDVALTFGSRGLELWLNGDLVDTDDYTGGLGSSSGGTGNREPISLGASQTHSGDLVADNLKDYFSGTLQNVRLIDQQLDGAAIGQLPVAVPANANTVFESLVVDTSNNDTVVGGQGNDTLYGNLGDDTLYGDDATVQSLSVGAFADDAVFIAEHQDSMLLNQGTLSFSFEANDLSHQYLFSKDSTGYDDGGHLSVYLQNDRLKVRFQSTNGSYYLQSGVLSSEQTYDVAFTFGSRGMELWLDGQRIDIDSYTGGLGSNGTGNREPIVLGASQISSGNLVADNLNAHFTGTLQNVRLMDQQLSSSEVVQLPIAPPAGANTVFEAFIVDPSLPNSSGNDILIGGSGNDTLYGERGDDILNGTSAQVGGDYELDILTGGQGADRFILGDAAQAYYDGQGWHDYAVITDFSEAEDTLQLFGSASNYQQQRQGDDLQLFYGSDLVAVLANVGSVNLNGSGFDYV